MLLTHHISFPKCWFIVILRIKPVQGKILDMPRYAIITLHVLILNSTKSFPPLRKSIL